MSTMIGDKVVCHCLGVTESDIRKATATGELDSLRAVMQQTGAGSGCTVCHRAIKAMLAGQCPSSSASPTCVTR